MREPHRNLFRGLGLFVVVLAAHWYDLWLPFESDDHSYLSDAIEGHPLSPSLYGGRILVNLSFYGGYLLWGAKPFFFHLFTIVLHTLCAYHLMQGFKEKTTWGKEAMWLGMIFAVAAGPFRAVQWVSAMAYPLALLGGLVALRASWRSNVPLTYLGLIWAALSHPAGAIFGPMLVAWNFYLLRGNTYRWKSLKFYAGPTLVSLIVALLLALLYPDSPALRHLSFAWQDILNNYLYLMGRLATFTFFFPAPLSGPSDLSIAAGILFVFILAIRRRFYLLFISLALLPFLFVPHWLATANSLGGASRYLYFATPIFIILLLSETYRWENRYPRFRYAFLILLMCVSAYTVRHTSPFSLYAEARGLHNNNVDLRRAEDLLGIVADSSPRYVPLEDTFERLCLLSASQDVATCAYWVDKGLEQFPDSHGLNLTYNIILSLSDDPEARWLSQRRLMALPIDEDIKKRAKALLTIFYFYYNFSVDLDLPPSYRRRAENYAKLFSGKEEDGHLQFDQGDPFLEMFAPKQEEFLTPTY